MIDLVRLDGDSITTTSKVISDVFGKVHRVVLKAINELDCSEEFRAHNFVLSYYTSPQNKKIKCYNITRDGFSFLCMGFTGKKAGKWKESYIAAFNQMEKGLLNVDKRINDLCIKGENIRIAGSEWSSLGRQICKQKRNHNKEMKELMSDVQLTLGFDS